MSPVALRQVVLEIARLRRRLNDSIDGRLRENGATNPEAAAAGWDGARYSLYDRDGGAGALIAVQTVWDSPEDATEFRDALVSTLAGPLDGEIGDAGQGRFLGLREVNGAVWFITSVDRAAVEAALAAIGG